MINIYEQVHNTWKFSLFFFPFAIDPFLIFLARLKHVMSLSRHASALPQLRCVALTISIMSRPSAKEFTTFFGSLINIRLGHDRNSQFSHGYGVCRVPFLRSSTNSYWQSSPHRGLFWGPFRAVLNFTMWKIGKMLEGWECVLTSWTH